MTMKTYDQMSLGVVYLVSNFQQPSKGDSHQRYKKHDNHSYLESSKNNEDFWALL